MYTLHRFLIDYDMAMLRALAHKRGITLRSNRQAEAADQLATDLQDPLSLRVALAQLSDEATEALNMLQAAGGRMRVPQFARRFGQVRPIGPGRLEREAPWKEPTSPAEELWYAGLIFRAFAQDQGGPGEFFFVPEDLRPLLPQPSAEEPPFEVEIVPPPPSRDAEPGLVEDLFAYLLYVQTHDVRPYADGRLGRHDRAALARRMAAQDERRLAFLRHLAQRLGFVVQREGFLRLVAAPVKIWLTAPAARRTAILQEAWRDDPTWNDLCHVPGLICDREPVWQNDPLLTRQALLDLLARCPLDEWWTASSFLSAVKRTNPDFQRPDGDYRSWYLRDAASGEYLSGFESWERVEGALILDLLAGPLRWLDVVRSVPHGQDPLCRLTEAGARFLGLAAAPPEEPPAPPIVVQPDFRVVVPPSASLYTRFQLERFAELATTEPRTYRLTAAGLSQVLSRGIDVEQILSFLRQASQDKLPANVVGQFRLWAGRFGQVEIEEVALLRVKEERVMKELSVLPETRDLIERPLSPTTALVRKQDLPRLRRELRKLGFVPPQSPVKE